MEIESSFLNPAKALMQAKIHEGQDVADFGAAGGFFTRAAARAVGDGVVWAVDSNGELLSRIKSLALTEGLRNVEVLRADIESASGTNLPKEHFDIAIGANILFSANNKEAIVLEMHRVLKKTGRAIIIDWSSSHGGLGPQETHVVTEDVARKLFEQNGFTYVEPVEAGAYHWGFIVRKKSAKDAQ